MNQIFKYNSGWV